MCKGFDISRTQHQMKRRIKKRKRKTLLETNWWYFCLDKNRPGEDEGDGGRQKSQSEDRSQALPPQLSGELEDRDLGDLSRDPGDSLSAPVLTSSCSRLESNSAWDFVSILAQEDNQWKELWICALEFSEFPLRRLLFLPQVSCVITHQCTHLCTHQP